MFVSGVQQSDLVIHMHISGLPWWLSGKNPPAIAGDAGLIPESERSPGEGNNNPLWHSSLEDSMDRGAWWTTVHRITQSYTLFSD